MRWRISIHPTSPHRSLRNTSAIRTRRCSSRRSTARQNATPCWRARANPCRRCRLCWPLSRCRPRKPTRRSPRARPAAVSIPTRTMNSPSFQPSSRQRLTVKTEPRKKRRTARTVPASISALIRWPRMKRRSSRGLREKRRSCSPPAIPTSSSRRSHRRRRTPTRPAKPSPARAKSPASISIRNRRPSGSGSAVPRAPRPRNASPTRSISRRAAKRCAGRSRSRKS